jgi:hypothetical protein
MFEKEVVVVVLQFHVIFVEAELFYLLVGLLDLTVNFIYNFFILSTVVEVFMMWVILLPLLHHSSVNLDFDQVQEKLLPVALLIEDALMLEIAAQVQVVSDNLPADRLDLLTKPLPLLVL